jgi:hypothetical protein
VAESPNFIALNTLTRQISKVFILVVHAGPAHLDQQLDNRVFNYIADAGGCSDRVAFHKALENLCSLFQAQSVHGVSPVQVGQFIMTIMLER